MKKIISTVLAAVMLLSMTTAFAQANRAIFLCYDGGRLVYSKLLKSDANNSIPQEFENTEKKVYVVDEEKFMTIEEYDAISQATQTASPEITETPKATEKPSATPAPTKAPAKDLGPYEREVDGTYAPALVTDVEMTENKDGEEVYAVTVFFHSEEFKIEIEPDLKIATAPTAFADIVGNTMDHLKKGDVICVRTNLAGDEVLEVNFITRPVKNDITTGTEDYGDSFEKLVTSDGRNVASKWGFYKFGEKKPEDKYSYAYGIIGKSTDGNITLLNKNGIDMDIDMSNKANVYVCDIDGKEYETEIGSIYSIEETIPDIYADDLVLNSDYSYNYALVRTANNTATDIILYNGYNR